MTPKDERLSVTPDLIARLEQLHAKATPGPWRHKTDEYGYAVERPLLEGAFMIAYCGTANGDEVNAELIAETRNALPDLIAAAKAQTNMHTAIEAFLAKWEQVQPAMSGAFLFQQLHGANYKGLYIGNEIEVLRSLVVAPPAPKDMETT